MDNLMKKARFLYFINYRDEQKEICELEMKSMFGETPTDKYIYSNQDIDPSRSIFIKWQLELNYQSDTLDKLEVLVQSDQLVMNNYKISYIKIDKDVDYDTRLKAMNKMGWSITGTFSLKNPDVEFGVARKNGKWLLGYYKKNDNSWITRKQKPHNYSFALDVWLAKTLINIAVGNDFSKTIVDPCCGIGTVLIEGRAMGVNIKGYDLNETVVKQTNQNLNFFGFNGDSECRDIKDIEEIYDVAIIDLPYGKFIKSHSENSPYIISNSKRISKIVIFVSMIDITRTVIDSGLSVISICTIEKRSGFSRYITICE
ncbi:hypothetical protein RJG79_11645 [Mycoplasmatota bacterium WC44]